MTTKYFGRFVVGMGYMKPKPPMKPKKKAVKKAPAKKK
jgi:hypothetical protein